VFHWLGEHETKRGPLQPLSGMPLLPTVPLVLSWIGLNEVGVRVCPPP